MLHKSRPHSAFKRPSTAVPKQLVDDFAIGTSTPRNNKQVLMNLIPDMPAFIQKNQSSTALLYSKFVVKGIKTNKIDLVRESFNMKKENIKHDKKMSLKLMKNLKSTRESINRQTLRSTVNETISKGECIPKSQLNRDDSSVFNLQINNFFRTNSNRKPLQQNQTERKLSNVQSEQRLQKRPHSAFLTPHKTGRTTRAQTANYRKLPNSSNRQNFNEFEEFKPLIPQRNILTIIQAERPGFGYKNFVQRNKRELSAASNKKTSIYLTGLEGKNDKEMRKMSVKKHALKKSMPDLSELDEFNFARNGPLLSEKQIKCIDQKSKQNTEYIKKNMPYQYRKYVQQTSISQNQNYPANQLLSMNLQPHQSQFGEINLNSKNQDQAMQQANDYFNEYAHICQETEYHINRHLKKSEVQKKFNQVLHVGNCQELLELERQRIQLEEGEGSRKMTQNDVKRVKEIKKRMFEIVKVLSFFKSKSPQACYKIFSLPFSIQSRDQDSILIHRNDPINHLQVILHGSVVRQSRNQSTNESEFQTILTDPSIQIFTNTLFDGQSFGEPENQGNQTHQHEYRAAEKVLLMIFPFVDYKKICTESQNIEERIQLLKDIFGSVPGCKSLNDEHLEALAFELEPSAFEAKTIVFRKEDICDKLIIVASGQISKVNEHILKRAKKNSKDMKKKNKSVTKLKLKNHSIQNLRRNNLKNYEVLKQNEEQFIFYYQDISKQLIKGDVINWQGFSHTYRTLMEQQNSQERHNEPKTSKQLTANQFKLQYSLISSTDNTKIYTLTMNKIQNLPQMLKEVILAKIDDEMKKQKQQKKSKIQKLTEFRPMTSIDKWDQYKQKICNDIINRKLKV